MTNAGAYARIGAGNYRRGTALFSLIRPCFSTIRSLLLFHSHSQSSKPNLMTQQTENALPRKQRSLGPNDVEDAEELLNRMALMRPFPPIFQINKALAMITKMGSYTTTLCHLEKVQSLGIRVDLYTLNIAINCYCHLNRVDFGFSLLGTVFKWGCTPDVVSFNTLLRGLILQDRTPEAMELFKEIVRNREVVPDVTYGTIINELCKMGNTITAIRVLRIMEEQGCKPNTIAYTVIIDGLCKDKMVDNALGLLFEMNEKGIPVDVVTYTTLIHGLCSFGKWKEARRILREMLDHGTCPNVCTFSVLVNALSKEGKAKEANTVLEVMIDRGVDPNVVTYSSLMDGYCLLGQMDEAMRVLNTMVDRGVQPDIFCYNILIKGYFKKTKIDGAMHVLREIPQRGLKPNVECYRACFGLVDVHLLRDFLMKCKLRA